MTPQLSIRADCGNWPRTALLSTVFILSAVCGTATVPRPAWSQEFNYSSAAFKDFNILFRKEYARARSLQLAGAGPVIVARGDGLLLLRGENRSVGSTVHPNYHDLKAVAHSTLSLFCILQDCLDQPLTAEHVTRLEGFRDALAAVENDLRIAFKDPPQLVRQEMLVQACQRLVERTLSNGQCTAEELDAMVDQLRPAVLANTAEAARLRLDNYHAQMKLWRDALSDDEWRKLHVIIPGASLPRSNSLAVRYFAKLFEQQGEGNRVIYAESKFEESQALQLLATHLLDANIGVAFFDDSSRMKRDLLGPYANAYLDTLDFEPLRGSNAKTE